MHSENGDDDDELVRERWED